MKPHIDTTKFGSITIDGHKYEKDVLINLDGEIKKRKKSLSKAVYGTSHKISKEEAKFVFEKGAEIIVVGSGQDGVAKLSKEAQEYFEKKGTKIEIAPTPEAIKIYNDTHKPVIGLFHITC